MREIFHDVQSKVASGQITCIKAVSDLAGKFSIITL